MNFTKPMLIAIVAASASLSALSADITGAGATFPFPVYSKWAEAFKEKSGIGVNYQSIGSSGGIKQIKAKTVDFGATDAPMKADEVEKEGLVQFPAVIGGVVAIANLSGVKPGEIKLTGDVLAKIFMGSITTWSDKQIKDLNPNVKLPDEYIITDHHNLPRKHHCGRDEYNLHHGHESQQHCMENHQPRIECSRTCKCP